MMACFMTVKKSPLTTGETGFLTSYKNRAPVVLRGTVERWNILVKWSPDHLANALGSAPLNVFTSKDNQRFLASRAMVDSIGMLPRDIVRYVFSYPNCKENTSYTTLGQGCSQHISAGDCSCINKDSKAKEPRRIYLRTQSMPEELYKDIATPETAQLLAQVFANPNESVSQFAEKILRRSHMQLWLGTSGNVTPLHYDRNHGLLAQIIGSKQVDLFSHEDTPYLYPDRTLRHTSLINLREFDLPRRREAALKEFPKFEEATRYRVILEPGELLYIPPFYWHDVTSLDNCLSITFPWDLEGNEEIPPIMLL